MREREDSGSHSPAFPFIADTKQSTLPTVNAQHSSSVGIFHLLCVEGDPTNDASVPRHWVIPAEGNVYPSPNTPYSCFWRK